MESIMNIKNKCLGTARLAYFFSAAAAAIALNMLIYTNNSVGRDIYLSNSRSSYLFFALLLPILLFSIFAGQVADRFNRQRVITITMLGAVIASGLLYLVVSTVPILRWQFPAILTLTFLLGTTACFSIASRIALLSSVSMPQTLKRDSMYLNILFLIAFGVGPLAAAEFIHLYSHNGAYLAIALLFLLSLLTILMVGPNSLTSIAPVVSNKNNLIAYINSSIDIKELLVISMLFFALIGPVQVLLPALAKQLPFVTADSGGRFISAIAAGLLIGGLFAPAFHRWKNQSALLIISAVISTLLLSMVSFAQSVLAVYTLIVLCGIFGGFASSLLVALLQYHTNETYRGRVMALYNMSRQGVPGVAGLIAGATTDIFGVSRSLAGISLTLGVGIIFMTAWRRRA
jgi:MFS family permease